MENASKALIIAGAILLSILIISLGIGVFNAAKEGSGTQELDATQIQTFNNKWEGYAKGSHTASKIRDILNAVVTHNISEENAGTNNYVDLNVEETDSQKTYSCVNGSDTNTASFRTSVQGIKLDNKSKYEIDLEYAENGLVCQLNIKKKVSGSSNTP